MLGTNMMDRNKLKALARELAKGLKTEEDLNELSRELVQLTVEMAARRNALKVNLAG